ncbi:MAG TPA: CinA family nicotinamide mononucleotide deamidase-related protein [Pirellulales bacterium]|jgi:nicotinamide-nucleotide amidase|nr:CinA family nicotinamide mononucleotide deamidase-related protein [Pirellulales bacterium]
MRAEVISIGDELTSGQRLDTNSQWLSERLAEIGVTVIAHATVADELETSIEIFRQAAERADIVISTGGLGPTADDLTRECLARVAGVELVLDEAQLAHLRSLFDRRKRPMPERNIVQATFPAGSLPIANPEGTAPGVVIDLPRVRGGLCRWFALPGVPAEMFQMWEQSVRPALIARGAGRQVIVHRRIKCFGAGESDVEARLPDLIRRGREPQVGITVSDATITLRIAAIGTTVDDCQRQIEPTVQIIHDCLGTLVFGEEDDELQHVVLRQLASRGQTLATCEWGTEGLLARWLGEAAAGGHAFRAGVVITNQAAADAMTGAQADYATGPGVEALAQACRHQFRADYGLAIGSFAAAKGDPAEMWFSLASPAGVRTRSASLLAHSAVVKPRAAKQALNLLRLSLL